MNLIGRLNIRLSEIPPVFPDASSAAERDVHQRSSNITFFQLAGTLVMVGLLFSIRHISIIISDGLSTRDIAVANGVITTILLAGILIAFWVALIRRWRLQQHASPAMTQSQRSLVQAIQEFENQAKRHCPGIRDGLNDIRRLLVRIVSQGNDTVTHRLISRLIHLARSDELRELVMEKPEFKPCLNELNSALKASLEGKEVLPLQPTNATTQRVEACNPVTTRTF